MYTCHACAARMPSVWWVPPRGRSQCCPACPHPRPSPQHQVPVLPGACWRCSKVYYTVTPPVRRSMRQHECVMRTIEHAQCHLAECSSEELRWSGWRECRTLQDRWGWGWAQVWKWGPRMRRPSVLEYCTATRPCMTPNNISNETCHHKTCNPH